MRTPQCTIQGSLNKPEDTKLLKVIFFSFHFYWLLVVIVVA